MKTEVPRAPETVAGGHGSEEARQEPAGPSFPEVLGPRTGLGVPGPALGTAGVLPGSETAGGEAVEPSFVTLAASVAAQTLMTSPALATRRAGLDASVASRGQRTDPLDPATRQVAQLAPPIAESLAAGTPIPGDAPVRMQAHASLEEVLPAIVRRIAWSGDGKKGSLRLEFGAGALAGGILVVHSDEGRVKVELRAPSGTDAIAWRDRIAARLEEKRIRVDELVVE